MSFAPYFTPVSEMITVNRRDFYLADTTLLDPNNANPLIDGEWMEINSSYQIQRNTSSSGPSWIVFAERGRYDTQAIGKTTLLYGGFWEGDTAVMDPTSIVVGSPVMVGNVTISSLTRRGLLLATSGNLIQGWVTRIIGTGSNQKLRVWHPGSPCFKP